MDFRLIKPSKKTDEYLNQEVYEVPVKILEFVKHEKKGSEITCILERLDFQSGQMIITMGITYSKSIDIIMGRSSDFPIETKARLFKEDNKIRFKVFGMYNVPSDMSMFHDVDEYMDVDEKGIQEVYDHYYAELRNWAKGYDDSYYDV